jgi:hypothetical protein
MDNTTKINVRNRSNSVVVYNVDDLRVRREFMPGAVKQVPLEEIYALSQQPGGAEIIANYLFIENPAAVKEMSMNVEPEYYLDDKGVIDLLKNGSVDALLDCLDFAPAGVLDLVQKYAIDLPLTDTRKIKAIKDKTGFDVSLALKHKAELEAEAAEAGEQTESGMAVERRVKKTEQQETTGRRTTPKYNVVKKS